MTECGGELPVRFYDVRVDDLPELNGNRIVVVFVAPHLSAITPIKVRLEDHRTFWKYSGLLLTNFSHLL